MRVTVWNEYRHELKDDSVKKIYPEGIHNCIADFLKAEGHDVKTATLDEAEHGLTQEVIDNTDVLIWWGHMAHGEVNDELVEKIRSGSEYCRAVKCTENNQCIHERVTMIRCDDYCTVRRYVFLSCYLYLPIAVLYSPVNYRF